MAARKQIAYVYCISDGPEIVYIGKGTGPRLSVQERRFGLQGKILEHCFTEDEAFARERHWISVLAPTSNICAGGNGGRLKRLRKPRRSKEDLEIQKVGSRRYVAKFLLRKLSVSNCAAFGLSKLDLNRLSEVANGPRC